MEYELAIDQWEQVLSWSNRYGDQVNAERAMQKLADLQRRLATPKLSPLFRADWFESQFDPIMARLVAAKQ